MDAAQVLGQPAATTTAATTQAATTQAATTQAATTQATGDADWHKDWEPELREMVTSKSYKSPKDVAHALHAAQKLIGADKIPVPKEGDVPGYRAAMLKLGASDKAEDYTGALPKELADDAVAKELAAFALEEKVPVGMFKGAMAKMAAKLTSIVSEHGEAQKAKHATELKALDTEWGAKSGEQYESAARFADKVLDEIKMPPEVMTAMVNAIGPGWANKLMAFAGGLSGEARFVSGETRGSSGAAMTPQQATAAIAEKMGDKVFAKRLEDNDATAHAELNRLLAFKNGQTPDEFAAALRAAPSRFPNLVG